MANSNKSKKLRGGEEKEMTVVETGASFLFYGSKWFTFFMLLGVVVQFIALLVAIYFITNFGLVVTNAAILVFNIYVMPGVFIAVIAINAIIAIVNLFMALVPD
jgi:hypothetical protein